MYMANIKKDNHNVIEAATGAPLKPRGVKRTKQYVMPMWMTNGIAENKTGGLTTDCV